MSWQATSWAARQTAGNSGRKALLLLIANAANPEGVCWVGRAELARECECQPGTVSANLAALEEADLISRHRRVRQNGSRTTDWIVLAPQARERGEMKDARRDEYPAEVVDVARRGQCQESSPTDIERQDDVAGKVRKNGANVSFPGSPEPFREQITEPSGERELVDARDADSSLSSPNGRTGRLKGRSVPSPMLDRAVSVLGLYNDIFGRALKPFSATGEQAPHLTQVLGKVIECPDMETADFERVLRAVHANPPGFLDGQPVGLGDIFGPRAWTRALENSGRALAIVSSSQPVRHDRYSDKRQREIEREEAAQRVLAARQLRED